MQSLSLSCTLEKSPLKDVTNSTPKPLQEAGSPQKITKLSRTKRSHTTSHTPQRRSTRLGSLNPELQENPDKEEGETSVRITRSRRKETPRNEGSVTTRKRCRKKEEGSLVAIRRGKRRSISTVPSSPLARKTSPQQTLSTPRLTRSTNMSAKTELGESQDYLDVPAKENEFEVIRENASPLIKYNTWENVSIPMSTEMPFKDYPLTFSPFKSASHNQSRVTLFQKRSPLPPFSCLKSELDENNIFAISPSMFPRKAKTVDYLDIMADAGGKVFMSPVKIRPSHPDLRADVSNEDARATPVKPVGSPIPLGIEKMDVILNHNEENLDVNKKDIAAEEQHPNVSCLANFSEAASIKGSLLEDKNPLEEKAKHTGIEDIPTVPAVVESASEPFAILADNDVGPNDNHDLEKRNVDIMTVPADGHQETASNEGNSCPETRSDQVEQLAATISNKHEIILSSPQFQTNMVDSKSPEVEAIFVSSPDAKMSQAQPQAGQERQNNDCGSLILYSEANDTAVADDVSEPTPDTQIPSKESIRDVRDTAIRDEMNANEESGHLTKNITPISAIGINDKGQLVGSGIQVFKNMDIEDNLESHDENEGLCLNGTAILVKVGSTRIISPPKRQISSFNQKDNFGKKRRHAAVLPLATRLDILRKRATRVRSREARHNIKRRDFTTALQPILDNLPSPVPKPVLLRDTPALIPPSFVGKRLQSPVTPAPTKRRRVTGEELPSEKFPALLEQGSARKEVVSPRKHSIVHSNPIKGTPNSEFKLVPDNINKIEKSGVVEELVKTVTQYEEYSKIFGPPPQLQKQLVEKDTVTKSNNSVITTTVVDAEPHQLKSPLRKQRNSDKKPRTTSKKKSSEAEVPNLIGLGRPVRNESFAIPSIPVPPGPPQLSPSVHRNNNKRLASANASILPSPAQPTPSVVKSALPRPARAVRSTLPVPATRRSTRVPKAAQTTIAELKSVATNVAAITTAQNNASVPEKMTLANGLDGAVGEKSVAIPAVVESVSHIENVTMDRPKGKLGGAQRVNRNGENKKVELCMRPAPLTTPPLTSFSQKELKSLTDANTKKNEGFKTVTLQPAVKRINRKRPPEPSDEFMVGKGGKWSKGETLPDWDRGVSENGKVKWKSPRFMAKIERKGAMRIRGILKRNERERIEKEDGPGAQCETLVVQRLVYRGEE